VVSASFHGNSVFDEAGTGPGIDGGDENNGRNSSRKEKLGTADESAKPNALGIVGDGGCVKSTD
jgi:hypothetical protein